MWNVQKDKKTKIRKVNEIYSCSNSINIFRFNIYFRLYRKSKRGWGKRLGIINFRRALLIAYAIGQIEIAHENLNYKKSCVSKYPKPTNNKNELGQHKVER